MCSRSWPLTVGVQQVMTSYLLLGSERKIYLQLTFRSQRAVPGITESVQCHLNQFLKRRVDWYDDVTVRLDDWLPSPHYPRFLQRRYGLHDTMHRQRLACKKESRLCLVSYIMDQLAAHQVLEKLLLFYYIITKCCCIYYLCNIIYIINYIISYIILYII